jgi:hypothetical protein
MGLSNYQKAGVVLACAALIAPLFISPHVSIGALLTCLECTVSSRPINEAIASGSAEAEAKIVGVFQIPINIYGSRICIDPVNECLGQTKGLFGIVRVVRSKINGLCCSSRNDSEWYVSGHHVVGDWRNVFLNVGLHFIEDRNRLSPVFDEDAHHNRFFSNEGGTIFDPHCCNSEKGALALNESPCLNPTDDGQNNRKNTDDAGPQDHGPIEGIALLAIISFGAWIGVWSIVSCRRVPKAQTPARGGDLCRVGEAPQKAWVQGRKRKLDNGQA